MARTGSWIVVGITLIILYPGPVFGDPRMRRALDDSDPEMHAYALASLQGLGFHECGYNQYFYRWGERPELRRRHEAGGNRLARYFIQQYEAAVREGYIDAESYLSNVAYAGSDESLRFFLSRLDQALAQGSDHEIDSAVGDLGLLARTEGIDALLPIARDRKSLGRYRAIWSIGRILDRSEKIRPDAVAELEKIELDRAEPVWIRQGASYALQRLASYQLIPPRETPPELRSFPPVSARSLESSRELERAWLAQHPAEKTAGCVRDFLHCNFLQ